MRSPITVPALATALAVPARAAAGDLGQSAVAILVPLIVFLSVVAIVGASLYAAYRTSLVKHETIRLAIEKGAPLPLELLQPAQRPESDLRRGVVLVFLGGGLALLLGSVAPHPGVWAVGAMVGLLGVGFLVAWALQRKLEARRLPPAA